MKVMIHNNKFEEYRRWKLCIDMARFFRVKSILAETEEEQLKCLGEEDKWIWKQAYEF